MSQGLSILAVGLGILAPVLLTVSYVLVPMARGIQAVTTAVRWLGAAISANPIILFGAALALVAVEVYRHWDGVKAFFVQLWADLTSIFSGAIEVLKGVATLNIGMITDGAKKMFEGMGHFVEHVFDGIGKGISTMVDDALDALGLLDKKQTDYAAKQLANTPQAKKDAAAAYLKTKGVDPDAGVMDTFFGTTPKPAAAPAPGALKWNTGAATDARPGSPASSAAAGGGAPVIQQSNVFHINQLPGEDGDALAHRTAGYLQQQNGVQQRGQLIDGL